MFILQVLRVFLLAAQVVIAAPILYKCALSVAAILTLKRRGTRKCDVPPSAHFAILIPAHNEEFMIGTLLENLSLLAYPKEQYTVYVIADNCTDRTAEVARATDRVEVYERFNDAQRGKGYALSWILRELEEAQLIHDAYVVLDADSVVVPTFLQSMNRELARGAQALQACNTVLNSSESASTILRWIAMTLHNHVRPLGRNALGASSPLLGNGMCLSRSLLIRHPWQAFSVSEDYQYYLTIMQYGERVRYVPDAVVRSHMPTTFARMRSQDIRWESLGGTRMMWHITFNLLKAGLRSRDLARIEAVADLLTPPLSVLVCGCLLALIASLLIGTPLHLLLSLVLALGLLYYVGTAFYLLRPSRAVYVALLLYAPGFMIWKVWVYFVLSRRKQYLSHWIRTSRPNEAG